MGETRAYYAREQIVRFEKGTGYLDVGCGRGEMVKFARLLDIYAWGVDPASICCRGEVSQYIEMGYCHELIWPDKSFDYSSMFDVLEHLIPGDEVRAMDELKRVTRKRVILTANNQPSNHSSPYGNHDLHINIRPYEQWDGLIRSVYDHCKVEWLPRYGNMSETWVIEL